MIIYLNKIVPIVVENHTFFCPHKKRPRIFLNNLLGSSGTFRDLSFIFSRSNIILDNRALPKYCGNDLSP